MKNINKDISTRLNKSSSLSGLSHVWSLATFGPRYGAAMAKESINFGLQETQNYLSGEQTFGSVITTTPRYWGRLIKRGLTEIWKESALHSKTIKSHDEALQNILSYFDEIEDLVINKFDGGLLKEVLGTLSYVQDAYNTELNSILDGIPNGNGEPILLLRAFLTAPIMLEPLAMALRKKGYDVEIEDCEPDHSPLRFNTGFSRHKLDRKKALIADIHARTKQPVTLIGWSLGGFNSMILANDCPEGQVGSIFTLGSPISMEDEYHIQTIEFIRCWRERLSGSFTLSSKHVAEIIEDMGTVAERRSDIDFNHVYSNNDGIVPAVGSMGKHGLNNVKNYEVPTGHCSMIACKRIATIVSARLAGVEVPDLSGRINRSYLNFPKITL